MPTGRDDDNDSPNKSLVSLVKGRRKEQLQQDKKLLPITTLLQPNTTENTGAPPPPTAARPESGAQTSMSRGHTEKTQPRNQASVRAGQPSREQGLPLCWLVTCPYLPLPQQCQWSPMGSLDFHLTWQQLQPPSLGCQRRLGRESGLLHPPGSKKEAPPIIWPKCVRKSQWKQKVQIISRVSEHNMKMSRISTEKSFIISRTRKI